jgi:hypothetical protein
MMRRSPVTSRIPELVVLFAWVCSRVLYYAAGLRFNATPVAKYWQFIDPELMRTDLLRSLFYLHMQPPGSNLLIGLVVKFFPHSYPTALQIFYLAQGVTIALALLRLMELFRVPPRIAAGLTVLFIVNPGCVLYENFATYEYTVLLLLLCAAIALFRFCQAPAAGRSLAFFAIVLALVMIRNQFHLIYVCLVAAGLAWMVPVGRRAVLIGCLPAIALTLALYAKNWALFGAFTGSTWAGMNSGVTTTYQLTPEEADRLIQSGVVSPLAKITPYSELPVYYPYIKMPPKTGIPVLDQEFTSTGHANFNHLAYLQLHSMYLADSTAVIRHYPVAYARSVMIAWFAYFLPASDLHSFDEDRRKIGAFDRIFSAVLFGKFRQADSRKDLRAIKASGHSFTLPLYTGMFLMVMLPILVLWAAALVLVPRLRKKLPPEQAVTLAFCLFTILFVTAVSNSLSSFENNRYRFPLDGYYLLILGMLLTRLAAAFRSGGVRAR